jgi:ATP-dependent 26S proteasome regulatory subunit
MNQLLSFTNGVFANNTKIIITTNKKIEDIDQAILRPGRCFDILDIQCLTKEEATEICKNDYDMPFDGLEIDGDEIQQSKLMMKVIEKLDKNEKNYILGM